MSQHTPGPWVIAELKPKEHPTVWGADDSGQVCELSTFGRFQAAQTEAQVQANARLIAAAPELLEALKFMLERSETGTFVTMGDRIACRAAIAKAEGRA